MPLPLIAAAAIGAGRTIAGLFQHKHLENQQKKFLGESYGLAKKQLDIRQRDVREGEGESMVARGMMGGGQASNTIAGQAGKDLGVQQQLETQDLDLQRREALANIKNSFVGSVMGDITGGVQTAANVSGAFGLHPLTATPQATVPQGVPDYAIPSVSGAMTGAPGTPNWNFHVGG